MEILDILIIGAGPIGLNCAIEAKKNNLNYLIIEKGTIVNSLYNYPLYMRFFSTAEKLEIDEIPFISTAPKPGRQEALEYYQGIARQKQMNIHLYEKVLAVSKNDGLFTIETSKSKYTARNVVIATGFYDIPNLMHIPGEDLPKVRHYYTEPYPYTRQKIVVVGSSNSAVDAALETYRKGADVTMIIRHSEISKSVKYWVKPDIENRIAEGSIKAYFNSEIIEIKEHSVLFKDENNQIHEIKNDFVLAMTGYLPDFDFLKGSGIELNGDCLNPVYNTETMETNIPNLYLAGVVCGGKDTHLWFIENSRVHARMIVNNILSGRA
ncbi:YpdA family putative bacillithiol disulfide reductase [Chryseobacterium indologenes]|uniref:YpdA family putative bacillithiol disulfide reductase n=1 Tax=Chryseobacterium indologenes TaxID=253 RepID=UPI000B518586|nr:YpdA family putative bacillithiol disulfide reductase [Chryseobacterium indologenes]ASE62245.1 YpdA family putative bacillithiol disulfide reductase [Chryseobacterium indologenes]AYZ34830.1 YpdA family putative bacillithiol disulfide reductase [Chryseobacterium indologenes]MBF6643439.1 YpdA family putative bacillithiol disulfide reductase [Chryseobacterium indologenes]MBU3048337.1 YpdA family putative bacillithiol disulfide reductase [Chryseobacterium indologenes]MEB4762546.1 YpdA family pu